MVDSGNCHTTSISQYVDHHQQPFVKELKSYFKDSTDIIKKMNKHLDKIPENSILVTMVVRLPSTSFPHNKTIKIVEIKLKRK